MVLTTTTLAIFAVVAAMGLVGVVAVSIISTAQDAEAQPNKNCPRPSQFSPGFNNTQKNCLP